MINLYAASTPNVWKASVTLDEPGLDNLQAWMARLEARPACQRGIVVPERPVLKDAQKMTQQIVTKSPSPAPKAG